ncbi:unnamed protein product, partial [Polarella glacialis]
QKQREGERAAQQKSRPSSASSPPPHFEGRAPGAPPRPPSAAPAAKPQPLDWDQFEKLMAEGGKLKFANVPWPAEPPATVSGASRSEPREVRKSKLRNAVLRWHPDKWGPVLEHFDELERAPLLERVKEVTRRILDEWKQLGK